jgi:hypothetical protein
MRFRGDERHTSDRLTARSMLLGTFSRLLSVRHLAHMVGRLGIRDPDGLVTDRYRPMTEWIFISMA